ncbi:sulfotransferase [Arenimonas sp.]|uniref:tetratricopeptide repeat-containing sulfotransferase family protein n=1 Tax=Arenimonas sp. TaxID=1872635 RepID=UPI0039E66053
MTGGDAHTIARVDALLAQGDARQAATLAQEAIAGSSSMALVFRLVLALLKQGRYRDAAAQMPGAALLWPEQPAELIELGKRLMYFNQTEALAAFTRRLLQRPVWHAAAECDFASLVSMAGEQELARQLFDRAIASVGLDPVRRYNRSQMLLYAGRLAEAEIDLRECLRQQPGMAKAWWGLSKLTQVRAEQADLESMRVLAARLPANSPDESFLRYAQFNLLDRGDRVDEAWISLEQACRSKRAQTAYDAAATHAHLQRLMSTPMPAASGGNDADDGPTPIFIVGMHRSGTTLLEHVLGNHSQVAEAGELYDFPAQLRLAIDAHFAGPSDVRVLDRVDRIDFAALGRGYVERVRWRAGGKNFLVDKLPSNFLNIGFLRAALPQAKILHMRRSAMGTCFSNLKELFSNACAYSYDQNELAEYFADYRRLMRHWHASLPEYVLDVSYEALTADPEAEARRVLEFCGLPWEPACAGSRDNARAVNTASSAQVREPIHRRSVEAWRRYETRLAPLRARLAALGELD